MRQLRKFTATNKMTSFAALSRTEVHIEALTRSGLHIWWHSGSDLPVTTKLDLKNSFSFFFNPAEMMYTHEVTQIKQIVYNKQFSAVPEPLSLRQYVTRFFE